MMGLNDSAIGIDEVVVLYHTSWLKKCLGLGDGILNDATVSKILNKKRLQSLEWSGTNIVKICFRQSSGRWWCW